MSVVRARLVVFQRDRSGTYHPASASEGVVAMSSKVKVRVSTIGEIAAMVPLLAGYEVTGSVVVLALGMPGADPRQVGFVARLDLPSAVDAPKVAAALMDGVTRHGAARAVGIAYPSLGQDPAPVLDALAALGIDVHDLAVCEPGRVRGHGCSDPECLTWVPLPEPPAGVAMRPVAASREAFAEALAASTSADAVSEAADGVPEPRAREVFGAWAQIADVDGPDVDTLNPAVIAHAVAGAAGDVQVRDFLAAWLSPGTLPADAFDPVTAAVGTAVLHTPSWGAGEPDGAVLVARLMQVCPRVPQRPQSAAALSVLASAFWYQGEGTAARVLLARALAAVPHYRLALLLTQMMDLGITPAREGR